jgi:5-methyltetrahydropteroyltriglutamate--homocysteine methyltransferase
MLVTCNSGGFPRTGESEAFVALRKTVAGLETGETNPADLTDAQDAATRFAIEEQARAGLELFTDGLIRWSDPVSHIAGKLAGVRLDGPASFFDSGVTFLQPVLEARPRRVEPLLVEEFRFARNALGQMPTSSDRAGRMAIKCVLTGPYTLAKLSAAACEEMQPLAARAEAYAEALAAEIQALAETGSDFIQVDEPAILRHPADWEIFARALDLLVKARQQAARVGRRPHLGLHVYFGDPAPLYNRFLRLPLDVLGLDFTGNPKLVEQVAHMGAPFPLGLGLVDGRSAEMEDAATLARIVERILPRVGGARAYLGPSCGLDALPQDRAYAKLELLARVRSAVHA